MAISLEQIEQRNKEAFRASACMLVLSPVACSCTHHVFPIKSLTVCVHHLVADLDQLPRLYVWKVALIAFDQYYRPLRWNDP